MSLHYGIGVGAKSESLYSRLLAIVANDCQQLIPMVSMKAQ
jgi:hypothetical protein